MSDRDDHKYLLKKEFTLPDEVAMNLGDNDILILMKYGHWLYALEKGYINPISDDQEHFLEVCKGYIKPTNRIAIAWYNFKKVYSRLQGGKFGYNGLGHGGSCTINGGYLGMMKLNQCDHCGKSLDCCYCS